MNQDEQLIEQELANRFDILDDFEITPPSFAYFRQMVEKQQAALRCAQRIQLALFTVVAAALVAGLTFCTGRFELFFFALQALGFIGAIAGMAVYFVQSKRLKEGLR